MRLVLGENVRRLEEEEEERESKPQEGKLKYPRGWAAKSGATVEMILSVSMCVFVQGGW